MRTPKTWETVVHHRTNKQWDNKPSEWKSTLEEDITRYISKEGYIHVMSKDNKQMALLYLQSRHLKKLKVQGILWEFSFLELEAVLKALFTLQGQSERIKNFPYPRPFATLNHFFIWVFVLFLPMALVPQFGEIGHEIAE